MTSPNEHSTAHTIRLRHPWEKTLLVDDPPSQPAAAATAVQASDHASDHASEQASDQASASRVNVPESSENLSNHSAVYQRRFNRPTSLTPTCTVRLEIESWQGELASLCINGVAIPTTTAPLSIDITDHLLAKNLIAIELHPLSESAVQLTGAINLVIQTQA